jgi:PRC-barrel domain
MTAMRCLFKSALLALLLTMISALERPWSFIGPALAICGPAETRGEGQSKELTPQQKMQQRFPQPVRVGDLIGRPVLDNDDNTLGYVQRVVRTGDGKIQLIVRYGGWFGWIVWWQRPVAVPIELVAMLGPFVAALDMPPREFEKAPTWHASSGSQGIALNETIRVAITNR